MPVLRLSISLLILLLSFGTVFGGRNEGGTLIVHANTAIQYTAGSSFCGQSGAASCDLAVTSVSTDPATITLLYVFASFPTSNTPNLSGITFGLQYDDSLVQLVDHGHCADFELATSSWPSPGEGAAITWSTPKNGSFEEIYWFAAYANESSTITLTPHPSQGGWFTDGGVPPNLDAIVGYGAFGFGEPGTAPCPGASDGPVGDTGGEGDENDGADPYQTLRHNPDNNVLFMFRSNGLEFPAGASGATVNGLSRISRSLKSDLTSHGTVFVEKLFPNVTSADTTVVAPDGHLLRRPDLWRVAKITVEKPENVAALVERLGENPDVEFAQPNYVGTRDLVPNDPQFVDGTQWHLDNYGQGGGLSGADINAEDAWDGTTGTRHQVLCLLDSGINESHEDLLGRTIIGDSGWLTNDPQPGHGTQVAGVAAAATNNGVGGSGVDWQCTIMNQAALLNAGDIATAVNDAISGEAPASVINMSFGFNDDAQPMRLALYDAMLHDILLVASMGNQPNAEKYPALYDRLVLAAGATTESDVRAIFSGIGSWIDLSAPGEDIYTTDLNGSSYATVAGTSFSAPIISAAATLLRGLDPTLTASDVENILERTADDIGSPGFDDETGWGRVNVGLAVEYIQDKSIQHFVAESPAMYVESSTGWQNMIWWSPPFGTGGVYQVRKFQLRTDVLFPNGYVSTPDVWFSMAGTVGYSAANPHTFYWPFASLFNQSASGCSMRTWVYEVRSSGGGTPLGWWPSEPGDARIAYTVAGSMPTSGTETAQTVGLSFLSFNTPARDLAVFQLGETGGHPTEIRVLDTSGRLVKQLLSATTTPPAELKWNLRDRRGVPVPSGVYFVEGRVADDTVRDRLVVVR